MPARAHRIGRQDWHVKTGSRDAAFAWRLMLRARLDSELLPALERAFDQAQEALGDPDAVLHIERLHVQLRAQDLDELVRLLPQAALREIAHVTQRPGGTPAPEASAAARPRGQQPLSAAEFDRDVLWHYLATGLLPWSAAGEEGSGVLARLQSQAGELVLSPAILPRVAALHAQAFSRLVPLLARPQRGLLCDAALGDRRVPVRSVALRWLIDQADLPEALHVRLTVLWLRAALQPASAGLEGELEDALQEAAERIDGAQQRHPAPGAVARLLRRIAPSGDGSGPALRPLQAAGESPPEEAAGAVGDDPVAPAALKRPSPWESDPAGAVPVQPADGSDAPAGTRPHRASAAPAATPAAASLSTTARSGRAAQARSAIPTPNAGLVLLHPYLPQLFGALGWLHPNGDALAAPAVPAAAALLHWLATGSSEPYEFDLPLAKLLLGFEPDTPVAVSAGLLDAAALEEGEALLGAAVQHWSALRDTGIEALRVSFLRRRGWLRADDRGWQVHVEPESFDLLLGRLPWAIGIIKLPWMKRPIRTEWPTP